MAPFRVGSRIRYVRGARASVFGMEGVVLRVYTAHGGMMLDVDFGTEVYPCYPPNVDLIPQEITDVTEFADVEMTTDT